MDSEGFFLALMQIGLGFAGFSVLITSFRRRDKELLPRETGALKAIILHSVALVLFAGIPVFLHYEKVPWAWIWRTSSFLLGALTFSQFVTNGRIIWKAFLLDRRGSALGSASPVASEGAATMGEVCRNFSSPIPFVSTFLLPTLVVSVVQWANVLWGSSKPFLVGLGWIMLVVLIQFTKSSIGVLSETTPSVQNGDGAPVQAEAVETPLPVNSEAVRTPVTGQEPAITQSALPEAADSSVATTAGSPSAQ